VLLGDTVKLIRPAGKSRRYQAPKIGPSAQADCFPVFGVFLMPQHFAEAADGFEVGGILGLYSDNEIKFDGVGLRSLFIEWLNGHPCERAGGGEKTFSGAVVSVRFTNQFSHSRG